MSPDPGVSYIDSTLLQGRFLSHHVSLDLGQTLVPSRVPRPGARLLRLCPPVGQAPELPCILGLMVDTLIIMHSDNACSCMTELTNVFMASVGGHTVIVVGYDVFHTS
jgi:hypothetical protein